MATNQPSKKPKPTQPANGAENKPPFPYLFLLLLLLLFLITAGLGYVLLKEGQTLAAQVFIALAPAIVLFGFLKSTGLVKAKTYQFGGAAALFIFTLAVLMEVNLSTGDDIAGMVYVDGKPVEKGWIKLLGTGLADNRRDFTEGNPGHFEFHKVPGLDGKDTLEFQIDPEAPVDLPPQSEQRPRKQRQSLRFELHSQAPPTLSKPALPLEWTNGPAPLGGNFVGRVRELGELDQAWLSLSSASAPPKRVVAVVAWGGFGKSALLRQWLFLKERDGWPGGQAAEAVFGYTFNDSANVDGFLLDAIAYFSGKTPAPGEYKTDTEKLRALREAIAGRRFVLVLDGLEPAQRSERGEEMGKAQNPLLAMLLHDLADGGLGPGLALIGSRLPVADLAGHPSLVDIPLEQRPLDVAEARLLLRKEGVTEASDAELDGIVAGLGRHPLALKTLASSLKFFNEGRAAGWETFLVDLRQVPKDGRESERQFWRVLGWYDKRLSADERRVMQVLAHFREPVAVAWAEALFTTPEGFTSLGDSPGVQGLPSGHKKRAVRASIPQHERPAAPPWTVDALHDALGHLKDLRLLDWHEKTGRYAMHPLVSEHFRAITENSPRIHAALYRLYAEVIQPKR